MLYIFYHRQTNGTWYSRQGCAEEITIEEDGTIKQVPMSSCGLNGGPLKGEGKYAAYIACNLFNSDTQPYITAGVYPKIMQDGKDGDEELGYIANFTDTATAGFKSFECKGVKEFAITTRGYGDGVFEIRTSWDGEALGKIKVKYTNIWERYTTPIIIPDGVCDIFIVYTGNGNVSLKSFEFITE